MKKIIFLFFFVGIAANAEIEIERPSSFEIQHSIERTMDLSIDLFELKIDAGSDEAIINDPNDDALRCVVEVTAQQGEVVRMSCWFCNCADLADKANSLVDEMDLRM